MRRLAIIGMGKMGRAIAELAPPRGWDVVARLDQEHTKHGVSAESLNGADVAVEFTVASAVEAHVRGVVAAGCAIVVGTTGWGAQQAALADWVKAQPNGAMLTAPNFSPGVLLFEQMVARAAELVRKVPSFDAHLVETHHAAKKDAPSGTAAMLARTGSGALGREIPITSVRTGSVPGTHEVVFDAPFETIRLEHVARDRRVFADGALLAAEWLIGKRGVFTMHDVLNG